MNRTFKSAIARRGSAMIVAGVLATTGCTSEPTTDPPAATTSPGTTSPMSAHLTDAVSYLGNVLHVGGVKLGQFDDYAESDTYRAPRGWPVLNPTRKPTQTDITIESKTDPFGRPSVTAVILRQNQLATEQHAAAMLVAEESLGLQRAPVIVESSVSGVDRTCYFRIKAGDIDGNADSGRAYSATIIAAGTARPSAAVWVNGGGTDTAEVERITREIAEALCAPPAS